MITRVKLPNEKLQAIKMGGGIRDVVDLADRLEKSGRTIYHLEIGRPDFDSPKVAKDAAIKAINDGFVHYADMRGVEELRVTLSEKLKRENKIDVSPANILITVGAAAALSTAALTILNRGDEVIVPTPCFLAYPALCEMSGAKMVPVPCRWENGFQLDPSDLEAAITDRTKMIILNTPNNPSGAAMKKDVMERVADIAIKRDIIVVSDECYERFLYDGEHISIASLPGMDERTLTICASSKTYSMTGWRVGYMAMPAWVAPHANRTHLYLNTSPTTFAQYGYEVALRSAEPDVKAMIAEYRARRDLVVGCLKEMPGLDVVVPEGAFYIFPRIERTGRTDVELCGYLLEHAGVALVPGEAFETRGFIRIAYCKPQDYLKSAMEGMKTALAKL
ncbi:MAG: pyridoxal phosphate-dependent aminotransferase [Synergistaceae bacterium]|jgi:aspartate aminotransferase/aminotransferase|nr:pyridoxal phosphate-dependent aminotransferase [Synergistaceae bacterium]